MTLLIAAVAVVVAYAAAAIWMRQPLPRIFHLGDPMGCNGCDAVTRPLRRLPNGGYYCPRCAEEIEATS